MTDNYFNFILSQEIQSDRKMYKLIFLEKFNRASSRENLSSGFATRVDSNRPAQPQKLGRGLKFRI